MEEENMETQRMIPTFMRKQEEPHQNSDMSTHGVHKSLHVFKRSRRRWREGSKELRMQQQNKEVIVKDVKEGDCVEKEGGEDQEEDDRVEIEKKIHALQRIVPGGESFGVDKLFDETAGYIVALQYQVKALRALTGFFEKLEKEKTKFGG